MQITNTGSTDLLIENARLIDGAGSPPQDAMALRISAGRIAQIGRQLPVEGAVRLDAAWTDRAGVAGSPQGWMIPEDKTR